MMTNVQLNRIQTLFVYWNAQRLRISTQESLDRFMDSWSTIPHDSNAYRYYAQLTHLLLSPFYSDGPGEIILANQMHQQIHFLRWMSYPAAKFELPIEQNPVTILDYGCGLAICSIETALDMMEHGKTVHLVLVDIETIMTDFLRAACKTLEIPATFIAITGDNPPNLPRCDVAVTTEVWEHLWRPEATFEAIHRALNPGGYLVSTLSDRETEMFHVSCDVSWLGKRLDDLGYTTTQGVYHQKVTQ